jgi:hypothetical protein
MIIAEIIKLLQSHHFIGAGKYTEIAKGKNELCNDFKRKIYREWQLLRK